MTYDDIDAISIPIDQLPVPPAPPARDEDSQAVLDEAIRSLTDLRFPLSRYDAAAQLHALASLLADIHARLPDVVADARDQDYRWDDIAICLDLSADVCRCRYASGARTNHSRTI